MLFGGFSQAQVLTLDSLINSFNFENNVRVVNKIYCTQFAVCMLYIWNWCQSCLSKTKNHRNDMSQSERKQIKKIYRLDNCSQISIGLSGPLQLHRQTENFSTVWVPSPTLGLYLWTCERKDTPSCFLNRNSEGLGFFSYEQVVCVLYSGLSCQGTLVGSQSFMGVPLCSHKNTHLLCRHYAGPVMTSCHLSPDLQLIHVWWCWADQHSCDRHYI